LAKAQPEQNRGCRISPKISRAKALARFSGFLLGGSIALRQLRKAGNFFQLTLDRRGNRFMVTLNNEK
jgi:hypothetical protein